MIKRVLISVLFLLVAACHQAASASSPELHLHQSITLPLKQRAAAPDSIYSTQGQYDYTSARALVVSTEPAQPLRDPLQRLPLGEAAASGVPGGIIGGVAGALAGLLLNSGSTVGETSLDLPDHVPQPRFGLDGSSIAAGAFAGWSMGTMVAVPTRNKEGVFPSFLASASIVGLGVALANVTDNDAVYVPLAVLQLVVVANIRR